MLPNCVDTFPMALVFLIYSVQIVYRRLNRHMSKMFYLMKKELSTGVYKLFIFFIINDIKRKKMCLLGKK